MKCIWKKTSWMLSCLVAIKRLDTTSWTNRFISILASKLSCPIYLTWNFQQLFKWPLAQTGTILPIISHHTKEVEDGVNYICRAIYNSTFLMVLAFSGQRIVRDFKIWFWKFLTGSFLVKWALFKDSASTYFPKPVRPFMVSLLLFFWKKNI